MTITSKIAVLAGASFIAMGAASAALAQPLANPDVPAAPSSAANDSAAAVETTPNNYIRPRGGIQEAVTDNVTMVPTNKQSDVISRVTVGADAKYDTGRTRANLSVDGLYEYYSKVHDYNNLDYRGQADVSYTVVDNLLAIEGAGARTQGSLTTFGTTDFFRSGNASDYRVSNYYIGPHLTISPGNVIDISAAARYGEVFFDGPRNSTVISSLPPTTNLAQVIAAADTKDRMGRLRIVTSGQYETTDKDFESTSGSVSGFYALTPRFSAIVRGGYDDLQLNTVNDLKDPFWSVGGQYIFNDVTNIRVEAGERYGQPYYSGSATVRVGTTFYLLGDYTDQLDPGAIQINNVLVDYVGGLDTPLPIPITPPAFSLNNNFYNQPSLNRTANARILMPFGRSTVQLELSTAQQRFLTVSGQNRTTSAGVSYTNQVRPDLALTLRYLYATSTAKGAILNGTPAGSQGNYALITARADYQINHLMAVSLAYQNRKFDPSAASGLVSYSENIGSIALTRRFW